MAPETIRGEESDQRADIYAVGAMMYKSLTGLPPFWAESPMGVLTKHLTEDVVPPSQRGRGREIPAEADAIVLRAMEKKPEDRYQRMEDLRDDLLAYLTSIGEHVSDSGQRPSTGKILTGAVTGRSKPVALATRGDVDGYEKRIRRRGLLQRVIFTVLLLGGLGAGGYFAWLHKDDGLVPTEEREPNGSIGEANALPPDAVVTAHLGRRATLTHSDQDLYAISNAGGRRFVRIEVTAIPNIDLALDIVRQGYETPVLAANSGGVGEPEIVPNFPLAGPSYWLRVREQVASGHYPTENMSDAYTIVWRYVEPAPDEELEVNDSFEIATEIALGSTRRGWIGWAGDVDTFCLEAAAPAVIARVDPPEGIDLAMRVVDRAGASSRRIDERGPGQHELVDGVSLGSLPPCFEVSAVTTAGGRPADASAAYTIRVAGGAPAP
jgi:serine/threonine-protein kinase